MQIEWESAGYIGGLNIYYFDPYSPAGDIKLGSVAARITKYEWTVPSYFYSLNSKIKVESGKNNKIYGISGNTIYKICY